MTDYTQLKNNMSDILYKKIEITSTEIKDKDFIK